MSGNPYLRGGDVITVVEEDFTGRRLQKLRANSSDEEEIAKIFQSVIDKYALNLKVIKDENKKGGSWLDTDESFTW